MIQEISEQEFLRTYGEDAYHLLAMKALEEIHNSSLHKNDKPSQYSIMSFNWKQNNPKWPFLIVECTLHKLGSGVEDFGFVKMILSDEEMPDYLLDKMNEIGKSPGESELNFNPES